MKNLTTDEFESKLATIPEEEPDEWDRTMIAEIDADNDINEGITLTKMDVRRKCNGKISLRVPKELHYTLLENAKDNGVSLNQYIVYKLAKA